MGFLYRNGCFMNFYVRRLLCQSLIFSNLEYCSPSWYFGLAAPLRESLNVLQRKCARFSLGHGPRSHIGNSELSSLHWLPFSQRVSYFSLVHAYKTKNGLSPTYISDSFTFITDVHSYNLRQSNVNFSLAHCLTIRAQLVLFVEMSSRIGTCFPRNWKNQNRWMFSRLAWKNTYRVLESSITHLHLFYLSILFFLF